MSAKKSKIGVITGATDGMGRLIAPLLAKSGYFVVVQGRSETRGKAVVDEITETGGEARFVTCNLASADDVRRFAGDLNTEFDHVDVLINNAGIGTGPDGAPREESADGLELRFAVNYFAPFLLTRLVLEKVKAAAPARIVNVASAGQEPLDLSNLQLERDYSGYFAYCRSKVALIMFTLDLAEELKDTGVIVNAMHPGAYMDTTMVREMNHEVVDSIGEGANFVIDLATHPKFGCVTGHYIDRGVDRRAEEQCYDRETRRKLREISEKLVGL